VALRRSQRGRVGTKTKRRKQEQEGMSTIRVAMCQILCLDGDREGNLARTAIAVDRARDLPVDIACFPETIFYGWVNPDAHTRARPIPGADSDILCRLAGQQGVYLCAGIEEKDGENLYDSALLIDDKGQILLKHRKIVLLSELMTPPYASGREVKVAETKFGRVGVLICADTHEQQILEQMASLKPALVLVPYGYAAPPEAWPAHGKELERVVRNAARVIDAPVIGTNLVGQITHGPWQGRTYAGHSVAADRKGRILTRGPDFEATHIVFDVPIKG
jgi:predicted amidohydrolase